MDEIENAGMRDLILLAGPTQSTEEQRLLKLATWMGVSTRVVAIPEELTVQQCFLDELQRGPCCFAMSAATLADLHAGLTALQQLLDDSCAELLVFGCSDSQEQTTALSWLTAGIVCGISQVEGPDMVFALPREAIAFSRQLTGLSFSLQKSEPTPAFQLHNGASLPGTIITANNRPIFIQQARGTSRIFLLAGRSLPDINEPVNRNHEIQEHYDRLIPVLIFLRYCFKESCWQGPEPTARLIIDDPLLTARYGFLDHDVLAASMRRSNYGTSIAFIPWNYWRTSRESAARVLHKNSNLSICIHGCDHTNKEFEAHDQTLLDRKAGLAVRRMELQRKRTDSVFEHVMVFPQGRFSMAAIPALRANNYLAAVNTTCFPTDSEPDDLHVGDFLRPAITRYNGFPLFRRHYPRSLFDLAFDLFLGKPALVVEHHEYFRDGTGTLEKLVAALYQIEPNLTWPTLTSQLTKSCLRRSLANGSTEIQFFTRRFQLVRRDAEANHFLLRKHEPDSSAIQMVLVDGNRVPFTFEGSFLKLEVQMDAGQLRNIEIVDSQIANQHLKGFGMAHNARVLVRRELSEFRDNTLSKHSGLLKAAKRVARGMKVTGDT
ncbi:MULTISPECIES: hypothetical protein [Acidobacteriaceae]|uniref:hypothetical protein n=1 Tax=Acidobacteriaceae TaxID=204434 RepID=UPI00131D8490|nr:MULTISPECIES: hypothetical protein [Acidobacteriaceae]MDW5265036.1 hypothetical protein [Edaphobacter sp.]